MNETTTTESTKTPAKQPGFFGRMFQKLDDSLKQKADAQAEEGCCCCSEEKGDKCC